jgi:FtsP/CotA-like multicopper oxidase with cupredoxin domain
MNKTISMRPRLSTPILLWLALGATAHAAAPGINGNPLTGSTSIFNLTAQDAYLNQPDGQTIYSWGYGCASGSTPSFLPKATFVQTPSCSTMQVPGPTLIVNEGTSVTITLTNNLPVAAGNTSILFPGFQVSAAPATTQPKTCDGTAAVQGLLTMEVAPGCAVTYTFTASSPGTHPYYSGTQSDLQVEMGLYGAVIVLPNNGGPSACNGTNTNLYGKSDYGSSHGIPGFPEQDFRLAHAAYDHAKSCYDREYLFQWSTLDARIHKQAEAQVAASAAACMSPGSPFCSLNVQTEPYHPAYFLINGRSMPDLMDPNYAGEYPHQPYNGNPHMHPGELTLIRTIGEGRWQHPFHEHANHVRILGRDGNLVLSPTNPAANLAGLLMFNTDTTPGQAFDGIFYFTGRGLNWDPYGHHPPAPPSLAISSISEAGNTVTVTISGSTPPASLKAGASVTISEVNPAGYDGSFSVNAVTPGTGFFTFTYTDSTAGLSTASSGRVSFTNLAANNTNLNPTDSLASLACTADANGYNTGDSTALNYYEWCQDHNKPVQANPFGDVPAGGPATLPDPNTFTNGAWYGGTPYLGPDASVRATAPGCDTTLNASCTTLTPANTQANPANERGWAFMWHSHNEREITTNNIFPGGMLMMMLVDSREFPIDESQ